MKAKANRPSKSDQQPDRRVRLRIICVSPINPEEHGAAFGLQDNSTTKEWVIHPGQGQRNGDIRFECECRVRRNQANRTRIFWDLSCMGQPRIDSCI
jgi:hypothetical protein